jgi:beta-lactamase superfamily II metal-dependent hydrolase
MTLSAGQRAIDMDKPGQKPSREDLPVVSATIFIVLASCIITAGCLDNFTIPDFSNNRSTHLADNEGKLSMYFLDVGQGDSTLVIFNNKTILIDAGESEMGDRVVNDLTTLGVTRIDLLVATHPHSDHIGGMQKVLAAFPVGQVLDSGLPHTSSTYEHFLETIDQKNIPYQVAEQGQTIEIDPTVGIFVLSPPKERFGDDPNTNSVVLRISYGTIDFLLAGDMGGVSEDALAASGYPLDAEILKVGHHGSYSSTSTTFLARVRPETAIISVGKDNPYGHPHQQTLDLFKDYGVTVYRTDRDGTVVVRSDGMSYSVKTETNDRGIWAATTPNFKNLTEGMTTPSPVFTLPTMPVNVSIPLPSFTLPEAPANLTIPVPLLTVPQIGNASSVYISALQFDAPGDDRQILNNEWVRLTNRGNGPVLLAGWTLSDKTGSRPYVFPAFVLMPESSVTVYSGWGRMNDTALFMGLDTPLWGNTGDVAMLKDGGGTIIDQRS